MLGSRALAWALLLLAAAALPLRAGEVVLNGKTVFSDEEPAEEAQDWSACEVRAEIVQTGPGGTRTLLAEDRLLIQGENLDMQDTVTIEQGSRSALLRLQVRVRASTTMPDGVLYLVTSEGELQAAVGFSPQATSRTQFRHDVLEIRAPVAHLREVYVSPELGVRVLLVVTATPIQDERETELLPPQLRTDDLVRFRVEPRRRKGDVETPLTPVVLQAALGRDATFAIALRDMEAEAAAEEAGEADPSKRFGEGVRVVDRGYKPDSGFGDSHVVERSPAGDDYLARNAERADQSYIDRNRVDLDEGPKTVTVRQPKKRKLSKRRQRELRDAAEVQAVREMAAERQKTLTGTQGAPAPLHAAEELAIKLTPLRSTDRHLRLEVRFEGFMTFGDETEPRPVDLVFVENVAWGQSLELGIRELLDGGEPEDDTIVAITPIP